MIVWYLNHYASFPESGFPGRPYYLCRSFVDHGHDAITIRASYHHLTDHPVENTNINQLSEHEGVNYYCVPARNYQGKGLTRFRNMVDYAHGISRLARAVSAGRLPKPDVMISSCPHPFAYPRASKLARRFKAVLIYEVRDLWPESLVETLRMSTLHPMIIWMSHIEKGAFRTAQAVVSLLPNTLDYMSRKGLDPRKFHHIPNGVSRPEWDTTPDPLPPEHQVVFDRSKAAGKLIVVYAGAHGLPNALDQILDLQRLGGNQRPYHFILIGNGVQKSALQQRTQDENIDFVTFLPRMKKSRVRAALRQSDICFIGWHPAEVYQYGISPNKIGDYFMAGKPIVHAVRAANDPVKEARAGISVEPYNPHQLDQALREFAAMKKEDREEIGARGRRYALENLEWSILGRQYVQLCELLVKNNS